MVQLLLATAERSRTAIRAPLLIARGIVHDANGRLPPRAMFDTIACSEPAAPTPMSTRALVLVAAVAMPVCPRNTSRPDTGNVVAACIWIQLPAVFAVPPAVTVVSSDDATSWPPIARCPASDRYQTARLYLDPAAPCFPCPARRDRGQQRRRHELAAHRLLPRVGQVPDGHQD